MGWNEEPRPSQDSKWYAAAEPIPDGPTTQLMCEHARKHGMVIVVPIYEGEDLELTSSTTSN